MDVQVPREHLVLVTHRQYFGVALSADFEEWCEENFSTFEVDTRFQEVERLAGMVTFETKWLCGLTESDRTLLRMRWNI